MLGTILRTQGRNAEALRVAREEADAVPGGNFGPQGAAAILVSMGRLDDAERVLRKAIAHPGHHPSFDSSLGSVLALQGRLDEAEDCWRRAVSRCEQVLLALRRAGRPTAQWERQASSTLGNARTFLQCEGGWEGYLHLTRMLRERNPDDQNFFSQEIRALIHLGRYGEALEACLAAVEKEPYAAWLHWYLMMLLRRGGKLEEHLGDFSQRTRAKPEDPLGWLLLGDARFAEERLEEALEAYDRVVSLQPGVASVHTTIGIVHFRRGDREARVASLRRAAELDDSPGRAWETWGNLAKALRTSGCFAEALEAAEEAVQRRPEREARWLRGWLEFRVEGTEAGVEYALEHWLVKPYGLGPHGFAEHLAETGLGDQAIALVEKILEQRPESSLTRSLLAELLALRGDPETDDMGRALELSGAALDDMPDSYFVQVRRAVVLSRAGRHADAVRAFDKTLELAGRIELSERRLHLAMSQWQIGRKHEARESLRLAEKETEGHFRTTNPVLWEFLGVEEGMANKRYLAFRDKVRSLILR